VSNAGASNNTVHPIAEGALVRLARDLTDEERGWFGGDYVHCGQEFVIEEFLPVADNPDPEPDDIPVDFYYGSANGGVNNVTAPADALEVVKTAAEMDARKPPTPRQILDGLDLLGDYDEFETYETEADGKGRTVYGKTADGLPFGFTLHVTAIWETDV